MFLRIFIIVFGILLPQVSWGKSKDGHWYLRYEKAKQYYGKKSYFKAERILGDIAPVLRGQKEGVEAAFLYAYCSFYQKEYGLSTRLFRDFVKTYPSAPQVEEATYMQGFALYKASPVEDLDQSTTEAAIELLEAYMDQYPKGQFTPNALSQHNALNEKLALKAFNSAKVYIKLKYYKAAIITLENIQKDFPTTELKEEIAFLKVTTQHKLSKKTQKEKAKEYYTTIDFCQAFLKDFPTSEYTRTVEKIKHQVTNLL